MSPLPKLTLYRHNGGCSLVTHILLTELSIPHTDIQLKFDANNKYAAADGSFTHEDYVRDVHPNGYIPALKIEDGKTTTILTENLALLTYIANLVPERQFSGSTSLEQATILSWLSFLSGSIHGQGFGALWRPARYIDGETLPGGDEAVQATGKQNILKYYGQVESRLGESGWAVRRERNEPTGVDWYLYLFFRWGRDVEIKMDVETYPRWTRLAKAVEGRPATRKVLDVEGLGLLFADGNI